MQQLSLHFTARLVAALALGCTIFALSRVQADTTFKGTEVRADAELELKSAVLSSTVDTPLNVMSQPGDVVGSALSMIGLHYQFGGNTPESGLDCSGFVRYVILDTLGFLLPRRAAEMSRIGIRVDVGELRPGDLLFFKTMRHAVSHVGIYIGGNKFVHAPSTGSQIRVDDLTASYWISRYDGARRIARESKE